MKEEKLALIFDVGTQATRALVFDTKGDPVLIVKQAGKLYISDGDQRAEADCVSVWRDICKVSLEAKEKLGGRWNNIVAVSVTSIRNSLVFLDKDGEPTRKSIFWLDKREVDVYPYIAWTEGKFVFRKRSLEEVMRIVSRWYNVDVVFESEEPRGISFSGNIRRYEDFSQVVRMLEMTGGLEFRIVERTIYIAAK